MTIDPTALGYALGSAVSTVGGLIGGNASAFKQYKYGKKLAKYTADLNYDYGIKSLQNSPSATRQGLQNAGYNPMLAVQNSTSGANAGWTSSPSVSAPDYQTPIATGMSNAIDISRLKNETEQVDSTVKAQEATARNQNAEAANKEAENPYISKQIEAELGKTSAETARLQSDTEYNKAKIENMVARLELDRYLGEMGISVNRINAGANVYNAETSRKHYNIDREVQDIIRDREKRYKEWGKKHPYIRDFNETIERYFNGLGVSKSFSGKK